MKTTREIARNLDSLLIEMMSVGAPAENRVDAVTTALAEREREVRAEQWQPIETAPENALVLIYIGARDACYLARKKGGWWYIIGATLQRLYVDEPTLWMRIPDPSTTQEGS